jgi:hypothetical protein
MDEALDLSLVALEGHEERARRIPRGPPGRLPEVGYNLRESVK